MGRPFCPREPDVLRAVACEWRGADAVLMAHLTACERCAEVRAAAELLRSEHVRTTQAARVPSPAAMWWRLERRIRAEQARRLQHLAFATHAVALAAAVGGAAAVLQIAAPWLAGSGDLVAGTWQAIGTVVTSWDQTSAAWTLPMAIVAAAWALLVPAAVYLGLAGE